MSRIKRPYTGPLLLADCNCGCGQNVMFMYGITDSGAVYPPSGVQVAMVCLPFPPNVVDTGYQQHGSGPRDRTVNQTFYQPGDGAASVVKVLCDSSFTLQPDGSLDFSWQVQHVSGPNLNNGYYTPPATGDLAAMDAQALALLNTIDMFNPNLYYAVFDQPSVLLQWTPTSLADSYNVYRNGGVIASGNFTTFTDTKATGLTQNGTFSYRISAIVGGIETAPGFLATANTQIPNNPVSSSPNAFPPLPAQTPVAGPPQNLTATAFNPQVQPGQFLGNISTRIWSHGYVVYPISTAPGFVISDYGPIAPTSGDGGTFFLAALRRMENTGSPYNIGNSTIFELNLPGIVYATGVGFIGRDLDEGINPIWFEYDSVDGIAPRMDASASYAPLTFPNGIHDGLTLATDQLQFTAGSLPGGGELYYGT